MEEENVFLPLSNDIMFKRFFGSEDYVFLTTMLVESIFNLPRHSLDGSVITNSVKLDRETVYSKSFELDVLLTTPNGDIYLLEMQPIYNANAEIKNVMYACKVFDGELKSGGLYKEASKATLINFSKEIYLHKTDQIISKYVMTNVEDIRDKMLEEKLSILIVDIDSKNDKTYNEISNGFKLMRELLGAQTIEEIEIAIRKLNEPLLSNLLKDMVVFMEMDYVQDYSAQEKLIRSNLQDAKEEGIALGRASGLAEGEKNKQLEIAKMLIQNTETSLEQISLCTGLSIEELEKIQEEMK